MSKHNSLTKLLATDKERKSEFQRKTLQYPLLPIHHLNRYISYTPMKFPKANGGYKQIFIKKQGTDDVKFTAIIEEIYGDLSMNKLRSMKIVGNNY